MTNKQPRYLQNIIDVIGVKNIRSITEIDSNGEEQIAIEFATPHRTNDMQMELLHEKLS